MKKLTFEQLKPTIVLAAVTTAVAALLIVTYNLTKDTIAKTAEENTKKSLVEAMGSDDFELLDDWSKYNTEKPDEIKTTAVGKDGSAAFEIIVNGYASGGIDIIIAIDEKGAVKRMNFVAISETPGLGSKVNDGDFLSKFYGISDEAVIVKNEPEADGEVQGITSATYSSKGVANAVNIALDAYKALKEGGAL